MKKIVFAALAMSLASSLAAQPKQTLSFDEALNLTLTNNPSIKASTYEQEAAERERKAAYGLRLPKIGVTGAYAYLSEDINIDLNGMKEPVGGLIGGMGGVLPPAVLQRAQALMKQNWALPLQVAAVAVGIYADIDNFNINAEIPRNCGHAGFAASHIYCLRKRHALRS